MVNFPIRGNIRVGSFIALSLNRNGTLLYNPQIVSVSTTGGTVFGFNKDYISKNFNSSSVTSCYYFPDSSLPSGMQPVNEARYKLASEEYVDNEIETEGTALQIYTDNSISVLKEDLTNTMIATEGQVSFYNSFPSTSSNTTSTYANPIKFTGYNSSNSRTYLQIETGNFILDSSTKTISFKKRFSYNPYVFLQQCSFGSPSSGDNGYINSIVVSDVSTSSFKVKKYFGSESPKVTYLAIAYGKDN